MKISWRFGGVCCSLLLLTGCNIYSFMDTPSGDAQLLSAARGCFDRGDYACATKYYGMLSGDASDQALVEGAVELLAQSGATANIFMSAVLSAGSSGGKFITKIAGSLSSSSSNIGQTSRLRIFQAYKKNTTITNSKSRGFVRFITCATLTAELLAENSGSAGSFAKADLVSSPTACLAASPTYLSASCNSPTGRSIVSGTTSITLSTASETDMSGSPNLYMINAAIEEMSNGLVQMSPSGGIASAANSFASVILLASAAIIPGTDSPTYRGTLISNDIGD